MSTKFAVVLIAGLLMVGGAMAQFATPPANPEDTYIWIVGQQMAGVPAAGIVWANADADTRPIIDPDNCGQTFWTFTDTYAEGTVAVVNEPPYVPNPDPSSSTTAETLSISGFGNQDAFWEGGSMWTVPTIVDVGNGSTIVLMNPVNADLDNVGIASTSASADATGSCNAYTAIATNSDTDASAVRSDSDSWVIVGAVADYSRRPV